MKKIISVLLVFTLILSLIGAATISSAQAESKIRFALSTDLHLEDIRETLEVNFPENDLYFHADGSGNLYDEATGLTKTMLSQAAQENVDFVLLSGDLTRSGTESQHRYVASLLKEFTEETGIKVYVISGNHDYHNSQPADFKEYYYDVCYKDALTVDDVTASYTADLPNNFRLIAVDSNKAPEDGDGLTERTFNWINQQVKQAESDGKKILYTMHHPVLEHLYLGQYLMKNFMVRNHEDVAEMFCDWGIQYVFTGHEHGNDIAKYESKNGSVLYDVLTTSLSSYPLEYRMVTYDSTGVDIKMKRIDECDFTSLVGGYNEKQLELMKTDYNEYAYGYFKYAIEKKILKYTSPDFINSKLKTAGTPIQGAIETLMTLVNDALGMPLYDSGDGKESIESLCEKKGVTLPESEYKSLLDLATTLVAMHYHGDENMPCEENIEAGLLIKGLNTALEYVLSGTESSVASLLFKLTLGNVGGESNTLGEWFAAVANRRDDTYEIAQQVLYPLLNKYTLDEAPGDRDVFLPASEEVTEKNTATDFISFIKKLIDFLDRIFNFIFNIFGE